MADPEPKFIADHEWFYGLLNGDDLDDHLKEVGEFLVRCWDSGSGTKLFLSFKQVKTPATTTTGTTTTTATTTTTTGTTTETAEGKSVKAKQPESTFDASTGIRHFLLRNDKKDNGWCIAASKDRGFSNLEKLIDFYQKHPLPGGGKLIRGSLRPRWLLKHCQIKFNRQNDLLGSGNFCSVYKALFDNRTEVACKQCHAGIGFDADMKMNSELKDLLEEGKLLSRIKHDNIIDFIGLCCDAMPVFVVMELCVLALLKHLENRNINILAGERIHYSKEIAQGMTYLQEKNLIHRDLAARNILFSRNGVCKIADFGLAKVALQLQRKEQSTNVNLPIRWMAPETIVKDPKYSTKCDVWAFGVLLYEMFTHGEKIYPDWEVKKVATYIRRGLMPKSPEGMPAMMSQIQCKCWKKDPKERPNFCDMLKDIDAALLVDKVPDIGDFTLSCVDGITMLTEGEMACLKVKSKSKMTDVVVNREAKEEQDKTKTATSPAVEKMQIGETDAMKGGTAKLVIIKKKIKYKGIAVELDQNNPRQSLDDVIASLDSPGAAKKEGSAQKPLVPEIGVIEQEVANVDKKTSVQASGFDMGVSDPRNAVTGFFSKQAKDAEEGKDEDSNREKDQDVEKGDKEMENTQKKKIERKPAQSPRRQPSVVIGKSSRTASSPCSSRRKKTSKKEGEDSSRPSSKRKTDSQRSSRIRNRGSDRKSSSSGRKKVSISKLKQVIARRNSSMKKSPRNQT